MQDYSAIILKIIAYAGTAAGVAFALFRFWGEKWIENKFENQLEKSRHDNARELEKLKTELNSELNRMSKILEKEFEILQVAWKRLYDASLAINIVVALLRRHADLDRMNEEQVKEYLNGTRLNEYQKQRVLTAPNKSEQYEKINFWYEYQDAIDVYNKFSSYIRVNSIFLRPFLKDSFLKIEFLMKTTLIDRELSRDDRGFDLWIAASRKMELEVGPLILALEKDVYKTLHEGEKFTQV